MAGFKSSEGVLQDTSIVNEIDTPSDGLLIDELVEINYALKCFTIV